jgi:hypothetical protein
MFGSKQMLGFVVSLKFLSDTLIDRVKQDPLHSAGAGVAWSETKLFS